jgi:hypothetical protein
MLFKSVVILLFYFFPQLMMRSNCGFMFPDVVITNFIRFGTLNFIRDLKSEIYLYS